MRIVSKISHFTSQTLIPNYVLQVLHNRSRFLLFFEAEDVIKILILILECPKILSNAGCYILK